MKALLALLLAAASLSACAQDKAPAAAAGKPAARPASGPAVAPGSAAARARDALHSIDPNLKIERIQPAPLPGFQAVIVDGTVLYVSDDGKYLIQGALYDVGRRADLGEEAMKKLRVELLRSVPKSDRIVFAPANPKYTVTVFTDVECGYCRRFHSQIAEYNRLGIAVQYLAFPRMGPGSADFRKMVAVWCAPDRQKALTDAKADREVTYRNCTNPVAMEYELGRRAGLTGTPMVLAEDGTQLGGYLEPKALRAKLDALAEGRKPAAGGAVGIQ